jgi:Putative lumazine-binding
MTASPADHAAIKAVIQTYLDGLYEGDADKLAAAFHPTSALAQSTDSGIQVTPRDAWLAAVRTRPSPKSQGAARGDEILSIDIAGPTMALVKLRCQIPPRYFTDQLSLLKIDGRWQIAQKVFQTETRGA